MTPLGVVRLRPEEVTEGESSEPEEGLRGILTFKAHLEEDATARQQKESTERKRSKGTPGGREGLGAGLVRTAARQAVRCTWKPEAPYQQVPARSPHTGLFCPWLPNL